MYICVQQRKRKQKLAKTINPKMCIYLNIKKAKSEKLLKVANEQVFA